MTSPLFELESPAVVGVDVGGNKKGFHGVALHDGIYHSQFSSTDAAEIAEWCRQIGAQFIGVDAPCRWSMTGRARPAERELMNDGIGCFSTPTRAAAEAHSRDHFGWMLNGSDLFEHLETTHPLFKGDPSQLAGPVCFETFPQAIACALAGKIVSAKHKSAVRRQLLTQAGIDAAHCALRLR